jgi:hypothetical protein
MSDLYTKYPNTLDSPASRALAITPSDSTDLTFVTKAIYVGGGGSIKVELVGDTTPANVTFTSVQAGSILPIRVRKIYSANTTATNIIGLY